MAKLNPRKYGKVAVLMGGLSAEREVSLKSGNAVLQALLRQGVNAHAVDVGKDVIKQLIKGKFDRVFNMLHGRGGEDGVMQGALQLLGLPYTGSGVLASALGMDKLKTKEIWMAAGLPTPEFMLLQEEPHAAKVVDILGLPLMIKPVMEGSSVGLSKVKLESELVDAWRKAREYDQKVLAEAWVTGHEYTVSILAGEALPMIRLETPNEFYDYAAKYELDSTQYHCPCGLDTVTERDMQALALAAFNAVGASGWGRVDLMIDENGEPWLIEVNTLPGMTDHSLVPMAAAQAGISFDALVMQILESSMDRLGEVHER